MRHLQEYINNPMILTEAFESKVISNMFNKGDENTKKFFKGHHDYGTALSKLNPIEIKSKLTGEDDDKDHNSIIKEMKHDTTHDDGKWFATDILIVKNNNLIARIRYKADLKMQTRGSVTRSVGYKKVKAQILDNFTKTRKIPELLEMGDLFCLPVYVKTKEGARNDRRGYKEMKHKNQNEENAKRREKEAKDHEEGLKNPEYIEKTIINAVKDLCKEVRFTEMGKYSKYSIIVGLGANDELVNKVKNSLKYAKIPESMYSIAGSSTGKIVYTNRYFDENKNRRRGY